jgi:hypothetical protein
MIDHPECGSDGIAQLYEHRTFKLFYLGASIISDTTCQYWVDINGQNEQFWEVHLYFLINCNLSETSSSSMSGLPMGRATG